MTYGVGSYGEGSYGEEAGAGFAIDETTITSFLTFGDTPGVASVLYLPLIAESVLWTDSEISSFVSLIPDTLIINAVVPEPWLGKLLNEILQLNEDLIQDSTYFRTFSEDLILQEIVAEALAGLLSDALTMTDTATYVRQWAAQLAETFGMPDTADPVTIYGKLIAEALALADLAEHYELEALTDSLALNDTFQGLATMYGVMVDSILSADTSTYVAVFVHGLTDVFSSSDAVSQSSILEALLEDDFSFVIWQGDDQSAYTGYVMNTNVGGLTEYQNYNFNSIAKIGSKYYGASTTGLYLLEGADDAGTAIETMVKFGAFDPGAGRKSRVEQAYIGVRTDGKMIFKTFADDGKERWYETQAVQGDLQTQRAKLGRGVKSRYWQFALVNRNGEPSELEQFEFLPVVLTRRV